VSASARYAGFQAGRLSLAGALAGAAIMVSPASIWGAEGPHVAASLVAETRSVVPGHPLQVALRQQIQPGWHTYWLNPGDSGLPTTIEWTLPPGFTAGAIVWPTPKRISYGPVVDYGYESEILLPVTIEVPANLPPGEVVLSAHASWLVCADSCIPEDTTVTLSIPAGSAPDPDPYWAERFAATRAHTPLPNPFPTTVAAAGDAIALTVATGDAARLRDVLFFPAAPDLIDDDAPQAVAAGPQGLTLTLRASAAKAPPDRLDGILLFRDLAAQAAAEPQAIMISAPIGAASPAVVEDIGFIWAAILGFLGGVLLNLMPCVLPVLSIKAFGLVERARAAPRTARLQGLSYTAGVLVSFAAIAAALIALRAAGAEIGWGFQLQSPLFVALMLYVLFAVGLNLSGVFSFGERAAAAAGELASHPRYAGSFLTGALATLVATPCTAPFMAAAIGYAITQTWYQSLAIFEALALGLAFPYLAIAFSPRLRGWLPKPGLWMVRLRQALAFPVYATAVWLSFVLAQEAGELAATAALAGVVLICFAAWLYEATRTSAQRWRHLGGGFALLSVVGALALLYPAQAPDRAGTASAVAQASLDWQPFSAARIDELQAQGRPIFVDFTADWCITCKLNERVALADGAVRKAFADAGVALLRVDWTRQDPTITRQLEANGRAGVPLYLFYRRPGPSGERQPPVILPQILTADTVMREIR
jgi:thiol:disulfide interchange protein